ncbi:bifunctional riboflavin kinase/FAD synthetase [Flavobacterium sp.]|uniref:bifunctional riboflavin kinase/FAD synthetase n=1 Tax=Flavobacterium sp. TaxID=239 RepID=UPI002B4B02C3|nr:bifunctional riboflavin kinase/FAD synthetase [Flavobacterium sp.]HLP64245.1 bifunctional riboflavin kinase/FAD synthetase [Flavobacterium sp.]
MKTHLSTASFTSKNKTIVTIGTFDGVHIGHQKILKKITQIANEENYESVVLTFFPHPRMVLQQDNSIKLLNTISEKEKLFETIGIDHLIIHPFDEEFSKLSAEDFVKKILVDQLNVQKIVIGYDHRFGKNRSANLDDLIGFGIKYHFEVEQISAEEINNNAVSSTKIRNSLHDGDIETANSYLGYHYNFTGIVVKGNQLGRTIGFPTANISIEEEYKLLPKNGVYIVQICIEGTDFFGMMNIGTRPTIDGTKQSVEVYILDFDKEIYNTKLTVSVLKFIREEKKFESFEHLKEQIEKDKVFTIQFVSSFIK